VQILLAQAAHAEDVTDLLAMPWQVPLEDWPAELLVQVRDRGLARHAVRFVESAGTLVALKEMPEELVAREHRLLTFLAEESVPAVELIGTVTDRGGEGNGILLTRYLEFSLPVGSGAGHRAGGRGDGRPARRAEGGRRRAGLRAGPVLAVRAARQPLPPAVGRACG